MLNELYDIELGRIFKTKRKALKLTQSQIADRLQMSISIVSCYEKGTRCMTFKIFKEYCDILGLKPDEVVAQVLNACKQ